MTVTVPSACAFCGGRHFPIVNGLPVLPCPNIPEGLIYVDAEYEHGPRGALFRLEEIKKPVQ